MRSWPVIEGAVEVPVPPFATVNTPPKFARFNCASTTSISSVLEPEFKAMLKRGEVVAIFRNSKSELVF